MLGELNPCGGGDPIPLLRDKLVVGRRKSCDISLRFPNVSSKHCELEYLNGHWRVTDLGSRNGIKVNGERIDTKWLMPGDILAVARHRYEVIYTPPHGVEAPQEANPFDRGLLEKAGLEPAERRPPRRPKPSEGAFNQDPVEPAPETMPRERKVSTSGEDDFLMEWLPVD